MTRTVLAALEQCWNHELELLEHHCTLVAPLLEHIRCIPAVMEQTVNFSDEGGQCMISVRKNEWGWLERYGYSLNMIIKFFG
jgi:hypothetical protein